MSALPQTHPAQAQLQADLADRWTVDQVAMLLGVSRATVRRYVREAGLPTLHRPRPTGALRFSRRAVLAWLYRADAGSEPPAPTPLPEGRRPRWKS